MLQFHQQFILLIIENHPPTIWVETLTILIWTSTRHEIAYAQSQFMHINMLELVV